MKAGQRMGTFGKAMHQQQRRWAVLAAYGGYLGLVVVWYVARRLDSTALFMLVIPLSIVLLAGLAVLFTSWVWHAANQPDPELDERQLRVRDRAYLQSYRVLAGAMVVATVYGALAWDNGLWLPATWNQVQALVWGVLLLTTTLPAAVIAWTEPDLPADG